MNDEELAKAEMASLNRIEFAQMGSETFLGRLNSATKYPSIPTYHEMGERGRLKDVVQVPFAENDELVVTEKIDGTNTRIIVFPTSPVTQNSVKGSFWSRQMVADYIIGSREDLLHARGDRILIPTMGIVKATLPFAEKLWHFHSTAVTFESLVRVYYGEVYGKGVGSAAKQYTNTGKIGFRIFDVLTFSVEELDALMSNEREAIARWRQHGGGKMLRSEQVDRAIKLVNNKSPYDVELEKVPQLAEPAPLPASLEDAAEWLSNVTMGGSRAKLDDDATGVPEGVVVRTPDRSKIAKLRFEDYARTLKR